MVNFLTLNGSIRKDLGSANTNRLRKEGNIPAVIYGSKNEENIYVSVLKKEFDKEYLKGDIQIRPIELNVDNKKYKVLVYQIDLDPVSDMPRHVDFIDISERKEVKVYIPVNFLGREKSPGIKKGGFLNILKRKIQFYSDPMNVPASIDIDVSAVNIGDKIKINDISIPKSIRPVDKTNFNICTITGRGKSTTDEAANTGAAATPAGTPAAAPANATSAAKAPEAKK